ncbi:MAG: S8 family serine peptidase [Candidatus Zixiibacteriota bacterium]|nr:MAG: S8 family serine peptidase [candidate division Zixibacteria bacterium]
MKGKHNFLASLGIVIMFLLTGAAPLEARIYSDAGEAKPIILSGEVEVQFESDVSIDNLATVSGALRTGAASLDQVFDKYRIDGARAIFPWRKGENAKVGTNDMSRYFVLSLPDDINVLEVVDELQRNPYIRTVSPVYAMPLRIDPDDQYVPSQWAIEKIQAPLAWDIQTGSEDVIFADIDAGVLYSHPDLADHIWVNPAEDNDNDMVVFDSDDADFVDSPDDPTGYVDDFVGYDFFTGFSGLSCWPGEDCGTIDNDPIDFAGHGTHIGGIVAGITNNQIGIAGLAGGWGGGNGPHRGIKIMCIRVGALASDGLGYVNSANCATGVDYATFMGADIINASWGADTYAMVTAFENAFDHDAVITHSAGNDNNSVADLVDTRTYNGYPLVLSVASSNGADQKSDFSNYGFWVDLAAPGENILSTYSSFLSASYASAGGTSMASPHVAGVAALIRSHMPELTKVEIDSIICATADPMPDEPLWLADQLGAGRVSAYGALSSFPVAAFEATSEVVGLAPLTVDFEDRSPNSPTSWTWDFGDGSDNVYTQNASHEYTAHGLYDVSLTVEEPRGTHTDVLRHLVMVTADSLQMDSIAAPPDTSVIMQVYVDNKFQAREIVLPIQVSVGYNKIKIDSLSVDGLDRTSHWENVSFLNYDTWNNRYVISMIPDLLEGSNYLQPDTGVVLNLYITITDQVSLGEVITLDSTSALGPHKSLKFKSIYYDYVPAFTAGKLSILVALRGDIIQDGELNLLDILELIDHLYGSQNPVDPYRGDVNGDGDINLLDVLYLIDHIYGDPPGPPPPPL